MFLERIIATKKDEVQDLKQAISINQAERTISELPSCRGFEQALVKCNRLIGLIAEVKKASPSKGLIRSDFHPVALAQAYERAGADCISVLTDVHYFQGSNDYLKQISEQVKVPLLRKDFIIDERQIYEARLIGADAVLLIAAILTPRELSAYYTLARDLGLDVLVEVHNRPELEMVLDMGKASLIGVNNRDLKTFVTDIKVTEQLISLMPPDVITVSESAISTIEDIAYVIQAGAQAVLVGEHFMRQPHVEEAVIELLGPLGKEGFSR